MLRVGVPADFDDSLRALLPDAVEVVRVPEPPAEPIDIEIWVPPYMSQTAAQTLPFIRGVKVIQARTAGVDTLVGAVPEGVVLCDGRGIHDVPAAEWVVSAILASLKQFQLYEEIRNTEQWKARALGQERFLRLHPEQEALFPLIMSDDLAGKRVLIVGYGAIGEAVERRLAPFEVDITRVSRRARRGVFSIKELDALIPGADIVVILVPLTRATTGLFDAARIGEMKQGALLVNAARGPVVETEALVRALETFRIAAALDVTNPEPLPPGHRLWKAPNLFLTPHIGGGSPRFRERAYRLAGQQIGRYMRNEPLINVVSEGY